MERIYKTRQEAINWIRQNLPDQTDNQLEQIAGVMEPGVELVIIADRHKHLFNKGDQS